MFRRTTSFAACLATFAIPLAAGQTPGTLDSLDAVVGDFVFTGGVSVIAVQTDRKILMGGNFPSVLGETRANLARLNADGTLDLSFDPRPYIDDGDTLGFVSCLVVQPDGKILIGGRFQRLRPRGVTAAQVMRSNIARLLPNGDVDAGFDPNAKVSGGLNPTASGDVLTIALQSDGRILIGGSFTMLQPNGAATPTTRNRIARLNADGSLDMTFDPNVTAELSPPSVRCVALQADGKILVGGNINALRPNGTSGPATTRNYVARLNEDGTLDAGFNPNTNTDVSCMAVQPDGKILLGGEFTTIQPNGTGSLQTRNCVARVNANGSLDPTFNPNAGHSLYSPHVSCMTLQSDGKIIIGGFFTSFRPNGTGPAIVRNNIARLETNGVPDSVFDPNVDWQVSAAALQADGKVLVGGAFKNIQPNGTPEATARRYFVRLHNDAVSETLSAPDSTRLLWQRGGASPAAYEVTFERSTDGGATYTPLGRGTRTGTGPSWQMTGLILPPVCSIRARGRVFTGNGGSSGLVEEMGSFTFPDIAVEGPDGASLADAMSSISFNRTAPGVAGGTKTFRIRNTGVLDLTGLALTSDGPAAGDFAITGPDTAILPPGTSTTFSATFTPGGSGIRNATLLISNNLGGARNPFEIALTGYGFTPLQAWNQQWFGDPDGTGSAAPGEDPNHNGVPNLLEYALGGDPVGVTPAAPDVLPQISRHPATGHLQFTFYRYPGRQDIMLAVQTAGRLEGPWADAARSTDGEPFLILMNDFMVAETSVGPARVVTITDGTQAGGEHGFMRMKVSLP